MSLLQMQDLNPLVSTTFFFPATRQEEGIFFLLRSIHDLGLKLVKSVRLLHRIQDLQAIVFSNYTGIHFGCCFLIKFFFCFATCGSDRKIIYIVS